MFDALMTSCDLYFIRM